MIRAVVLDYGGVLSRDQGAGERTAICAILGVAEEPFHAAYWTHRAEYDRGALDCDAYWCAVCVSLGVAWNEEHAPELARLDAASWSRLNPAMTAWARDVASRMPVALLSNMPHGVKDALLPVIHGIAPWAATVFSCDVRTTKPDREIYLACARLLGVAPDEAIMVDDRRENVLGAERAGLSGVHFTGVESFVAEIQRLL